MIGRIDIEQRVREWNLHGFRQRTDLMTQLNRALH